MIYKEGRVENGELKFSNEIEVDQSTLNSDCWLIQIKGLAACKTCEFENTDDCGGGETLTKLVVTDLALTNHLKDHWQEPRDQDIMTILAFKKSCKDGCFTDNDGNGYLLYNNYYNTTRIYPSDILSNNYNEMYTHIIWFNK